MIPMIGDKPTREEALAYCEARLEEKRIAYDRAIDLQVGAAYALSNAQAVLHEMKIINQKFLEQLGYA